MSEAPPTGARVGPYLLERLLGRGGMGEVWLAHDEALDRPVALKLIAGRLAEDPELRLRFLEETRLAASLDHPHIVPIYASGEADGRLYLAMRYVEGSDLETLIGADGRLEPGRAVGLLRGVADALDAAHAKGLVHRDVKPGNILVTRTAAGEHAYLTDFGLAKRLTGGTSLDGGRLVGSMGFVAPELIDGLPVDGRADVYSLGCTLYAALAGRSPFARESEPASLLAHLEGRVRPLAEERPGLAPLDPVLDAALARDPGDRPASAGDIMRAAADAIGRPEAAWTATAGKADIELPYVGLRSFEEADARFFVGREDDVEALLGRLREGRFLAVFGPSGGGKSSLVRAGLVPALRAGKVAGSDAWPIATIRPGALPLETLAARLVGMRPGASMASTVDDLASDPRTLHFATELALADAGPDARLVWVVDQAEELFTLAGDGDARAVIANVVHASTVPGGRTIVVLAMRADFYHRCAAYPGLASLVAGSQYLVSPLSSDQLERTIVEPARMVGLELEPGLVETILEDVADRPGALPLLEHLLFELWDRRRGATLTLAGYRECGGIEGAIAARAEATYAALSDDDAVIVRRVFLRLVQPGEGTEDTRRRATLRELGPGSDAEATQQVVDELAAARLLTLATADVGGEPVVDLAHEALLRAWPRLRAWIDEDREALRTARRIAEASAEWERLVRDRDALLAGARLAEAGEFLRDRGPMLTDDERTFVEASMADRERRARDARRRQRAVVGVSLGLAVFFLALSAVAFTSWRQSVGDRDVAVAAQQDADTKATEAEAARQDADARRAEAEAAHQQSLGRQLIAQSLATRNDLQISSMLALAATQITDSTEAWNNLSGVLDRAPEIVRWLDVDGSIIEIAASADGSHVAVATQTDDDGKVMELTVWQTDPWQRVAGPIKAADASARGPAGPSEAQFGLNSDGSRLAYVGTDDTVTVRDIGTGSEQRIGSTPLGSRLDGLRFDGDDATLRWVLTDFGSEEDGTKGGTTVWSLRPGETAATARRLDLDGAETFGGHLAPVTPYAVVDTVDEILVFDARTGNRIGRVPGNVLGFGADGLSLVAGLPPNGARVYRLPSLDPVGETIPLAGSTVWAIPDLATMRLHAWSQGQTMTTYALASRQRPAGGIEDGRPLSALALAATGAWYLAQGDRIAQIDRTRASRFEIGQAVTTPIRELEAPLLTADGRLVRVDEDNGPPVIRVFDPATGSTTSVPMTSAPSVPGRIPPFIAATTLSADGSSLLALDSSGRLTETPLDGGPGRELATVTGLPDLREEFPEFGPWLAPSPDGSRVAVVVGDHTDFVARDGSTRQFEVDVAGKPAMSTSGYALLVPTCDDRAGNQVGFVTAERNFTLPGLAFAGCPSRIAVDPAGSTAVVATDRGEGDIDWALEIATLPDLQHAGSITLGREHPYDLRLGGTPDHPTVVAVTTDFQADEVPPLAIHTYDLAHASWVARTCGLIGRNPTHEEWERYVGDETYQAVCPELPVP